jgi:hypothetical protein
MAIPESLVAGDSWALTWDTPVYREVDSYSAELFFALGTVRIHVEGERGEADEQWVFVFPPAETEKAVPPGQWLYWIVCTKAAEIITAEFGKVEVLPNPHTDKPIEPRSILRQTLDEALKARREVMSSPIHQSTFQGHSYTMADLDKLDRAIRRLQDELAGEEGGGPGRSKKLVFTQFRKI